MERTYPNQNPQGDRKPRTPAGIAIIILRTVLILSVFAGTVYIVTRFLPPLEVVKEQFSLFQEEYGIYALVAGGLVYGILLSIPFMPGAELGWLLMYLFGREGILLVYICTVLALNFSFAIGRKLPRKWVIKLFKTNTQINFGVDHALSFGIEKSKFLSRLGLKRLIKKYNAVLLFLLFNLPGNSVLGGGGGIALIYGMDRRFPWPRFFLTVVLGILPVPLVLFFGLVKAEIIIQKLGIGG